MSAQELANHASTGVRARHRPRSPRGRYLNPRSGQQDGRRLVLVDAAGMESPSRSTPASVPS